MKKIVALVRVFCMTMTVLSATAPGLGDLATLFGGSGDSAGEGGSSTDLGGLGNLFSGSDGSVDLNGIVSMFGGADGDTDLGGLGNLFSGSDSSVDLNGIVSMFGGTDGDTDLGGLGNLFSGSDGSVDLNGIVSMFGGTDGDTDLSGLAGIFGGGESTSVNTVAANSPDQFYGKWTLYSVSVAGYEIGPDLLTQFGMEVIPVFVLTADSLSAEMSDGKTETKAITASDFSDGALTITVDNAPVRLQLTDTGYLLLSISGTDFGVDATLDVLFAPAT